MSFDIEGLSFDDRWLDNFTIRLDDIRRGWFVNISALAYAAGMSHQEIVDFLNSKGIEHSRGKTNYDAVEALKDWYLKKMRRYVRNAIAQDWEPGSSDEILFLQFCNEYRRIGHNDVRSWDDIDEFRLLQDFEAKCLGVFPALSFELRGVNSILDKVHRSFLFHLRIKKPPKHNECRVRTILSIILCNRYHIFSAEADSFVYTTDSKAYAPDIFKLNTPRSTAIPVLCPWPTINRHETIKTIARTS